MHLAQSIRLAANNEHFLSSHFKDSYLHQLQCLHYGYNRSLQNSFLGSTFAALSLLVIQSASNTSIAAVISFFKPSCPRPTFSTLPLLVDPHHKLLRLDSRSRFNAVMSHYSFAIFHQRMAKVSGGVSLLHAYMACNTNSWKPPKRSAISFG
jgi:hypothetical protein